MESQRLHRIDDALQNAANTAAKEHYSPAAVAQVLMTALRGAAASLVEEVDELEQRVHELELSAHTHDEEV